MSRQSDTFDVEEAMRHLCRDIGPRPAGGSRIAEARHYLGDLLQSIGQVRVVEEPVQVWYWKPETSSLEAPALEPEYRAIPAPACFGAEYGVAAGPLVPASSTDRNSSERDLAGKVVLVGGPEATGGVFEPLGMVLQRFVKRGASAIVLESPTTTDLPAIENVTSPDVLPVPCVAVSGPDAGRLRNAAASGSVEIRIATSGVAEWRECANLVGTIGPSDAEIIVLSAHLDTFWNSPGAFDNLTGVVTVLETARRLMAYAAEFKRSLRVIFFTAEEIGMLGSKAYVRRHRQELDRHCLVYNMDSIFPQTARGVAVMMSEVAAAYLRTQVMAGHSVPEIRPMFCMSSDYLPFILEGIAAARPADFEDAFPDWSHTTYDTFEHVDMEWIRQNAEVHARVLLPVLLDEKELPWGRRPPAQVRELLRSEGVVPALRSMGFEVPGA